MDIVKTIKVKPWGKGQGDFVEINEADFDEKLHELLDEVKADPITEDEINAAIALLDGANDDHWTAAGLPAVDAVAEIAGKPVTRAAIEAVAPDLKRPAA